MLERASDVTQQQAHAGNSGNGGNGGNLPAKTATNAAPESPATNATSATPVPFNWEDTEAANAPLGIYAKIDDVYGQPILVWSAATAYSDQFTNAQTGDPVLMAEIAFSYAKDYQERGEDADRFLLSTSQWRIVSQVRAMHGSTRFPFVAQIHRLPDKNKYGNYNYQLGAVPPTIENGRVVDAAGRTSDLPM